LSPKAIFNPLYLLGANERRTVSVISKAEVKDLIEGLFEEEALVIGGIVALYGMEDSMVWRLMRNLDEIRRKTLKRFDDEDKDPSDSEGLAKGANLKPHPAIEEFLLRVRKDLR
jgi:hypothetical protein